MRYTEPPTSGSAAGRADRADIWDSLAVWPLLGIVPKVIAERNCLTAVSHADALLMLADALDALDRGHDAAIARDEALIKLRAKGNLAAVARLTRLGGQRSPSS